MHQKSEKRHDGRSLLAVLLVIILIFHIAMPIEATNELQEPEEITNVEQTIETEEVNTEFQIEEGSVDIQTEQQTSEQIDQEQITEPDNDELIIVEPDSESLESEVIYDQNEAILETEESTSESESPDSEMVDEMNGQADMAVMAADAADIVTAPDLVGNMDKANEWQIVSEEYAGREQANKKGYDIDSDGSDDIFYQKNVIPTSIENEFRVYMGITKRMTWDELLAESEFAITSANNWHKVAIGTQTSSINGNHSIIYPGKSTGNDNNYEAVVNYTRGGKVIHTYRGWYHGTSPNCSHGTGFIWMKSLKTYLVASHSVDLGNGGNQLTYTVDLDAMTNQNIHFSVDDIVVDSVQDTMGDYITYENIENCDGTNSVSENTLIWNPTSNGASGIEVRENGGLTGYHYNIHQLVYRVHLKAEQQEFNSCAQNMNSVIGDPESYKVNQQAILNCHMGSYTGSPQFQIPYVRGLLYDLEFQKIIKDSKISLTDISFGLTRQTNNGTLAEQLERADQQKTDSNGWIKFHNLPWGTYTLQELAGEANSFQDDYLNGLEQNTTYIQIGKVINEAALNQDHSTGHTVDWTSDIKNMLVKYNGTGIFENTPNSARITIKKIVKEYDSISADLKDQNYTINTTGIGEKDIYLKPTSEDMSLQKLMTEESELRHEESVAYDLVVPKTGGVLSLEEVIPESVRDKVVFESVKVEKNEGSTENGDVVMKEQGCELTVLPGNDLVLTITNVPVGKLRIKKVIDNFQQELAEDAFIISIVSVDDNGQTINTEAVLKHQEISGTITVKKTTTFRIDEIVPKEYSMSKITVSGGGKLNGNLITVAPGEDVEITVHNTYSGKPFFHASDAVKNIFK